MLYKYYNKKHKRQLGGADESGQFPAWGYFIISLIIMIIGFSVLYFLNNKKFKLIFNYLTEINTAITTNTTSITKMTKDSKPIAEAFKKMTEFLTVPPVVKK